MCQMNGWWNHGFHNEKKKKNKNKKRNKKKVYTHNTFANVLFRRTHTWNCHLEQSRPIWCNIRFRVTECKHLKSHHYLLRFCCQLKIVTQLASKVSRTVYMLAITQHACSVLWLNQLLFFIIFEKPVAKTITIDLYRE